jgi:glyoxylase-like metal-dependent hydrolase (beta-lactamase superfamily II)
MNLSQHGDNLFKLTRMLVMNFYLVRESDGLTLIDSGMAGSAQDIIKAAQTIGLSITRITLTHAHADHAGSLDEMAALLPDAEVTLNQRTAEFLQGNLSLKAGEPQDKLRGGFVTSGIQPNRLLQPGDMVGSLRVVAAPGHTPDQVAFYDERDGSLIAGDAFQTQGGIAVAGVIRWRFPLPALATWHLPTALSSAQSLRALKPSRLAVGHGKVLEQPLAEIDRAIQAAEKKVRG